MRKVFGFIPANWVKYIVTLLVFAVWVTFFDRNDLLTQNKREQELQDAKDNVAYLRTEIAAMNAQTQGLKTNPAVLEKFAREKYLLKKENEDVFIFE